MDEQFQPHRRPNRSQLEQWREQITRMRQLNWPFTKIADWLLENHNLHISAQAIHKFCQRRGIPDRTITVPSNPRKRSPQKNNKHFDFDEDKPIERYRQTAPLSKP